MAENFATIDEYIASYPPEVQEILQEVRRRCLAAVPGAEEAISYGIPTLKLEGRYVVYFAGWKHHISVYPVPDADADFLQQLAPYKAEKGTLKFRLNKPIPYELISRTAELLAEQRRARY